MIKSIHRISINCNCSLYVHWQRVDHAVVLPGRSILLKIYRGYFATQMNSEVLEIRNLIHLTYLLVCTECYVVIFKN